jgi:hypothetical protein
MSDQPDRERRRGAARLAEIVGKVLDPVAAKRGFATASLVSAWPEIVGRAYADCTAPERIVWPRRPAVEGEEVRGVLVLRVAGPKAVYVQHEAGMIAERVNGYLGFRAIERIKIVQAPVAARPGRRPSPAEAMPPQDAAALAARLGRIEDERLRAALERLGRNVFASRAKDA